MPIIRIKDFESDGFFADLEVMASYNTDFDQSDYASPEQKSPYWTFEVTAWKDLTAERPVWRVPDETVYEKLNKVFKSWFDQLEPFRQNELLEY